MKEQVAGSDPVRDTGVRSFTSRKTVEKYRKADPTV
jgi:hypothetical protein